MKLKNVVGTFLPCAGTAYHLLLVSVGYPWGRVDLVWDYRGVGWRCQALRTYIAVLRVR